MRRLLSLVSFGLLAGALLVGVTLTSAPPAAAATIAATTVCSNGVDNTPGLGLICEVTVNNTITASGGSATVTVRECHGAAGDPEASCTVETSVLAEPVTAVTQCNDSTNGGGGTLRCSVRVTNTFVGVSATPTAVTVNQCVGSGDGITIGCDPFPATTTGATITQCNGSANGGTLHSFITALYQDLLERKADGAGLAYWKDHLRSGRLTRSGVAENFYASIESRRDRVVSLHQEIFGTTIGGSARDAWANRLYFIGDVALAAEFAATNTYWSMATS